MVLQSSMGRYKLDIRYGDRNTIPYYNGILDGALLTDADVVDAITAGRAFSLTTAQKLVPGILAAAGAGGGNQPFFSWSGLDINNYPDSARDRGMPGYFGKPAGGAGGPGAPGWGGIPVSSELVGPFATIQWQMAGELSTSVGGFDQSAGAVYAVGAPLTAVAADSAEKANRGLIRPVELATDTVIGYVAPAGVFTGAEGYKTLAFVPHFTQGTTVPNTIVDND